MNDRRAAGMSLIMNLAVCGSAFGQMIEISGRVTSLAGPPLPGVTVRMRGTDPATTTDEQGRYSLAAPAAARDGVVVFTLTGYRGIGEAIRGEVWARRGAHDRVDLRHSAHQGGDRVPQDAGPVVAVVLTDELLAATIQAFGRRSKVAELICRETLGIKGERVEGIPFHLLQPGKRRHAGRHVWIVALASLA